MNDFLQPLVELLAQGQPVVRAVILTQEGSTPRSAGSRMLLAGGNGALRIVTGTVGGGLVEARVMARAAQVLAEGERAVESFDLTGELAAGADMICGGRLRVFLERLGPGDLALHRQLAASLERGERALLFTPLGAGLPSLLTEGSPALGAPLPEALERNARELGTTISAPVLLADPDTPGAHFVLEPWAAANPLAILGAGHVSRATAQVAAIAGFDVLVLDDRPDFANAERFPFARTRVLQNFADALKDVPSGPGAFLVIVTRGHVHDADVLAQALRTRAGYIGMIGSRRKRDAVYDRLRGQGFTEADFTRVHCPIGLDIGAETPEEIAVSIVAELIQMRAGQQGA
jgi:xanthine dehydrogenase accessory factor